MSVSKRVRYEVLRRDEYTCRYCRSTDGALTVDHVTPVALGGTDQPENLVTACRDCNAGKSSTAPDAPTLAYLTDQQIAYEKARATVIARERKKVKARAKQRQQFLDAWKESAPYGAELAVDWKSALTMWLSRGLTIDRVVEAVHVTGGKSHLPPRAVYPYMCKILWNWITELEDTIRAEAAVSDEAEAGNSKDWTAGYDAAHSLYEGEILGGSILRFHIDGLGDRIPAAFRYEPEAA